METNYREQYEKETGKQPKTIVGIEKTSEGFVQYLEFRLKEREEQIELLEKHKCQRYDEMQNELIEVTADRDSLKYNYGLLLDLCEARKLQMEKDGHVFEKIQESKSEQPKESRCKWCNKENQRGNWTRRYLLSRKSNNTYCTPSTPMKRAEPEEEPSETNNAGSAELCRALWEVADLKRQLSNANDKRIFLANVVLGKDKQIADLKSKLNSIIELASKEKV